MTQKQKIFHNITAILRIECCMCDNKEETDELSQPIDAHDLDVFASALKGEGWGHGRPKGFNTVGILCPTCIKEFGKI